MLGEASHCVAGRVQVCWGRLVALCCRKGTGVLGETSHCVAGRVQVCWGRLATVQMQEMVLCI